MVKLKKSQLKELIRHSIRELTSEREDVTESKKRRFTVKEVRMWMKKLEENRYKKVYNSDARRVAWMVNNEGVEISEMPKSMSKKWSKAQYGRERYLATEFIKSKSEQMTEGKLTEISSKAVQGLKDKKGNMWDYHWKLPPRERYLKSKDGVTKINIVDFMTGKGKFNWKKEKNLMNQIHKINKKLKIGVLVDEEKLTEKVKYKKDKKIGGEWYTKQGTHKHQMKANIIAKREFGRYYDTEVVKEKGGYTIYVKPLKEGKLTEAISGADRKILFILVREIVRNLKSQIKNIDVNNKSHLNRVGSSILAIIRAMSYSPDNANYKNFKKYFPKGFNSKLIQKKLKQFHSQTDKVQMTLVTQAIKNELGEGVKEAVRASVARFLYIPKKDIKRAIKVVKSMPFSLKGKVEIQKKPSDKVKGFYAITTEKQLFNAVVEFLATADIGVKTISQGKM